MVVLDYPVGRKIAVGIATCYGLYGHVPVGGEIFLSRPALMSTQPPFKYILVSLSGIKAAGP